MPFRTSLLPLFLLASVAAASSDPCYGFFGCEDDNSNDTSGVNPSGDKANRNNNSNEEDCSGFGCPDQETSEDPDVGFKTPGSCTPVSFDMTTTSEDVTFDLICNDAAVWTYPSALIPASLNNQVSVKACVFLDHACCHFRVHDNHDEDDVSLSFQVDKEAVLSYNSNNDPAFTTLARSFGQTCQATPTENITPQDELPQDVKCQFGQERPLSFKITLDEQPEDLSWFLVCHNPDANEMVTVWDTPRGSLAGHVGQTAQETACIPYDTTCAFNIIDAAGNGLTTKGSGYTLTLGVSLLEAYIAGEKFDEKSYCIGDLCGDSYRSDNKVDNIEEEAEQLKEELEEQEKEQKQEEKELEHLEEELEELEHKDTPMQEEEEKDQPCPQDKKEDRTEDTPEAFKEEAEAEWTKKQDCKLIIALGVVSAVLVLAGFVTYFLHANGKHRQSSAVLGAMKPGMFDTDDDDSTEPDEEEGTFVLDA